MKRLLLGDHREELLSTLELILRHWGYRVLVSSDAERLRELLEATTPELMILGSRLLTARTPPLRQLVSERVASGDGHLVVLAEQGEAPGFDHAHENLEVPVDVFSLFAIIQQHVEKHPRKNLRLAVKLPGMFCAGETCNLSEVLSLSMHGLFIRTGAHLTERDQVQVTFPLMGMSKELELDGRVTYRIKPGPENKYMQGVGIEFIKMDEEHGRSLRRFIESCFLGELSASQLGSSGLDKDQIRNVAPEITLKMKRIS